MIFLTVGNELPFDRLVEAVDRWCAGREGADVFGQLAELGPGNYRPKHFEWCGFLSPAIYESKFDEARMIVSHAGMGSIITALTDAKPILIMPRRLAFRETRNDHQVATAERFRDRPGIIVAADGTAVGDCLDGMTKESEVMAAAETIGPFADPSLLDTIRGFIRNQ